MATSVEPPLNQVPGVVYLVRPDIPPSATMMGAGGVVDVVLLIDPAGRPAYFSVHAADSNDNYPEFLLDVVLKDGTKATLEFYIAPQENELLYVTIKDEPKVFRFAEYLQRVLPQWRFRPALRNGEPAYGFVYIHYNFCAPDDEDCVELTIST